MCVGRASVYGVSPVFAVSRNRWTCAKNPALLNFGFHPGELHGTATVRRDPTGMDRRIRRVQCRLWLSRSEPGVPAPAWQYGQHRQAPAPAGGEMARVQLADRFGRRILPVLSNVLPGHFPARLHGYGEDLLDHLSPARLLFSFIGLPEYRGYGDLPTGLGR